MNVLMFGWEFPPYSNGGLGTACYGLTKSMNSKGVNLTFVIPKAPLEARSDHVDLVPASNVDLTNVTIKEIEALLGSYMTPDEYTETLKSMKKLTRTNGANNVSMYGANLLEEVHRYAEKAKLIAAHADFDIIHAHDWLTYKAGMTAKRLTGKPLVVHMHATEFDRTGGNPFQPVYDIEREGMHAADKVIAVSNYTKNMIVKHYGVPPEKIEVVHNAVDTEMKEYANTTPTSDDEKMVLFLGRLTIQKGPDYFLYAAKRVLEKNPKVKFMVAGSGDMERFMIQKAAELGISDKFMFTGFLRGEEIDKAYQMADLYVMPSVSEPFGITPLEALKNNTPVLISNQSGVSEVLANALKVDFWDVDEMSNKILAVLNYPVLQDSLREMGKAEVNKFTWDTPAQKCIDIYNHLGVY